MRDFKQWARVWLSVRWVVTRGVAQSRDSRDVALSRAPAFKGDSCSLAGDPSQLHLTDQDAEARVPSDAVTTSNLLDQTRFAPEDLDTAVQTVTPSTGL